MSDKAPREPRPTAPSGVSKSGRTDAAFRFDANEPDESIPDLVRRLADEGSHLAEQQLKLIETEVHSAVGDLKESVGAMAGAAILGITGLGILLMGLSFLLAKVLPLWLATLIVAAVTLGGAYAMFIAGQKRLQSSSLSAERTRRTLKRAPKAISGHANEDRKNDQ